MNEMKRRNIRGNAGIAVTGRARMIALCLGLAAFHPPAFADEAPEEAAAPQAQAAEPPAEAAVPQGEAAAPDDEDLYDEDAIDDGEMISDPLEPVNRAIFAFNDKLYFYVLKPTARAYRVLPQGMRVSVSNFFSNLGAPIRLVNALFQFKLLDAGNELLRFGVNTTVGIGGLFDPARRYLGLREKDEDFGQTLGNYGVGAGPYLVLPILGPSSVRDGFGRLVDGYYFDPVTNVPDDTTDVVALKVWDSVNFLSLDKDSYEAITRESLDPYTFFKNAYAQNRAGKVAQ
jgi:phospholipid-binding lipoprotein MlaA